MKVYWSLEEFEQVETPVVTTGTFDGVHLGHSKILNRMREIAELANGQTTLLTFNPHPRIALYPDDHNLKLLNTLDEKTVLLEEAGIEHLIIHPFTKEFSRLSSVAFVRDFLVNRIGVKKLVIGYNHHFSRNREGAYAHLQEYAPVYGFDVEEISAHTVDEVKVSSSKIRQALLDGNVDTANKYLGYAYSLAGTVAEGSKLGREIGFPTANIIVTDKHKLIPADGVYAVKVNINNEELNGMLNIGFRPTLKQSGKRTIEVHIFDFDKELYHKEVKVMFIARIRNEKRFSDAEALKKQLETDRNKSKNILV